MSDRVFVIAIDGPSSAGKSTTARAVAEALGLHYLDSGALYRAVAVACLDAGCDPDDEAAVEALLGSIDIRAMDGGRRVIVDGLDVTHRLRSARVSEVASRCSALPAVRRALIDLQRDAVVAPGAVVEGRDMGSVVFPDAALKVYLDASIEERARRRTAELRERGDDAEEGEVREQLGLRDERDRSRSHAPLKIAPGAITVDTTERTPDQVVAEIVRIAERRKARN